VQLARGPLKASLPSASFLHCLACCTRQQCSRGASAMMDMERKEEGMRDVGSLPIAAAASSLSGEERKEISAAAAEPGQLPHEIWERGHLRTPPSLMLMCAPVSCACMHIGAPLAHAGPAPRLDAGGRAACELCGRRLSTWGISG
jgi:hypothetical protein